MPIDPSIPLSVKTPEPISPLATIGGLMQMREMASQIALRTAQTQTQQQQAQDIAQQAAQRERDNQSANSLRDLMKDPAIYTKVAKGDYSPIYGAGISANVASAAIKNFDEQRKTAQGLETGKADLYAKQRGWLKDMLEGADSEKDDAISASQYNGGRQTLGQQAPDLAKNLPILQPGPNYRQQLAALINTNGFHHAMLEEAASLAAKSATTEKDVALTAESKQKTAVASRAQALQELSAVDPANQGAYQFWASKHSELSPPPAYNADWVSRTVRSAVPAEKQPEYDLTTIKAKLGVLGNSDTDMFMARYAVSLGKTVTQLSFPEYVAGIQKYAEVHQDPTMRNLAIQQKNLSEAMLRLQMNQMPNAADIQVMAKSVLDKTLAPAQFQELRAGRMGGVGTKVFTLAKQMDPTFDMQKADAQFRAMERTENDFTSGKEATLVRSNNNAIEHLGLLDQARVALRNHDLQALNAIGNWVGVQSGSDVTTVFDHIASRVGDEVSKAFIPGGGSAGERVAAAGGYNSKMSDQQLQSNIRADIHLMDSQQRNLQDQYMRGTYNKGAQQLFTEQAAKTRDRVLGSNKTYKHMAQGGNGHMIGSDDGKTWYDAQTGQKIQ